MNNYFNSYVIYSIRFYCAPQHKFFLILGKLPRNYECKERKKSKKLHCSLYSLDCPFKFHLGLFY